MDTAHKKRNRKIRPLQGVNRRDTLRKRLAGLDKKITDLSGLTGVSVACFIWDPEKEKLITKGGGIIDEELKNKLIQLFKKP